MSFFLHLYYFSPLSSIFFLTHTFPSSTSHLSYSVPSSSLSHPFFLLSDLCLFLSTFLSHRNYTLSIPYPLNLTSTVNLYFFGFTRNDISPIFICCIPYNVSLSAYLHKFFLFIFICLHKIFANFRRFPKIL